MNNTNTNRLLSKAVFIWSGLRGYEPLFAPFITYNLSCGSAQTWAKKLFEFCLRGSSFLHHYEKKKEGSFASFFLFFGADYGARTRHLDLGKVALYQMS